MERGRPQFKEDSDKQKKRVIVYLTEQDYEKLKAVAKELDESLSSLLYRSFTEVHIEKPFKVTVKEN